MNVEVLKSRMAPASGNAFAIIAANAYADHSRDLPGPVRLAAVRCLVDWFGLAVAGLREEPTRMVLAALHHETGAAPVVGLPDILLPGVSAALVMGTASHVLDYDDTDYINLIHVSSTLFPALFALVNGRRVSGRDLLSVFAAAYEAEDRYGFYLGRKLTVHGWHVSGIIGHLGSALACSMLRGLPQATAQQAMAISSTGASGFIAAFGTMSKPLQLGRCAAAGVLASALAEQGFTGPIDGLNRQPGFTGPWIGEAVDDWSHIETVWGHPHSILRNSFKPHASCMITHPIVDGASALRRELGNDGIRDIDAIECQVNPLAPKVAGYSHPVTGLEGKFSVAYCCAVGLLYGRATPDCFTPDVVGRPEIRSLLDRMTVTPSPSIGEQSAVITVRLQDGRTRSHTVKMAKGNPENPLTDTELGEKFTMLTEPMFGQRTAEVLAMIENFDAIADVGAWLRDVNTFGKQGQ
jgi:2-methylcitrate dehydratase PrpD